MESCCFLLVAALCLVGFRVLGLVRVSVMVVVVYALTGDDTTRPAQFASVSTTCYCYPVYPRGSIWHFFRKLTYTDPLQRGFTVVSQSGARACARPSHGRGRVLC